MDCLTRHRLHDPLDDPVILLKNTIAQPVSAFDGRVIGRIGFDNLDHLLGSACILRRSSRVFTISLSKNNLCDGTELPQKNSADWRCSVRNESEAQFDLAMLTDVKSVAALFKLRLTEVGLLREPA